MEPKFKIGQQYKTRGLHPRVCTIQDIWKTYDSKGELVRLRYISTHELIGQLVWNRDVCETTVAMGLIQEEFSPASAYTGVHLRGSKSNLK